MLTLPRLLDGEGNVLALDHEMITRFKKALETNGFHGNEIILNVPGKDLLSSMIELPPIDGNIPIDEIAKMEMSRIHHCEPDEFELASWLLPRAEKSHKNLQVIASIYQHEKADSLLDLFEFAKLKIKTLDIMPHALARACRYIKSNSRSKTILNHTYDSIHLVAVDGDTIIYERRIADLAFGKLVSQVQGKFNIDDSKTAIRLIMQVGFEAKDRRSDEQKYEQAPAIRKMINEHYQNILQELGDALSYTKQQCAQMSDQIVCLTGSASNISGWREIIEKELESEVFTVTPQSIFEADSYLQTSNKMLDPGFISAIGLACYDIKGVYHEAC